MNARIMELIRETVREVTTPGDNKLKLDELQERLEIELNKIDPEEALKVIEYMIKGWEHMLKFYTNVRDIHLEEINREKKS